MTVLLGDLDSRTIMGNDDGRDPLGSKPDELIA